MITITSSSSRLPRPGEVIAYEYLWSREADRGQENGRKSRPCLVLQVYPTGNGARVYLVPITSQQPKAEDGTEVPPETAGRLRLYAPCWVLWSELNFFDWPGPDLGAVPESGRDPVWLYGMAPAGLYSKVRDAFLNRRRAGRATVVRRT